MNDVFFQYKNELEPAKGRLLISEPHLPDMNFERTVVLLCEHNEEGSFGFVLNKDSKLTLGELVQEGIDLPKKVKIGGPVEQNTLHFLHSSEMLEGSTLIAQDVYCGGDFKTLLALFENDLIKTTEATFYLGYSGWGAGQLADEIEINSWIVYEPKNLRKVLDTKSSEMWTSLLNEMGGRFSMYSKYPEDPRLN
jgi:putative transcriptional regulator